MRAAISFPKSEPDHISRAAFACLTAARTGEGDEQTCAKLFPNDSTTLAIISRAPVSPGTTVGWGSDLVADATHRFVGSLSPYSAIAQIMPNGLSIAGTGLVAIPQRAVVPVIHGGVAEGGPIPVRAGSLTQINLSPSKIAVISIVSGELARRSVGEAVIETILKEDAGSSMDAAYLSTSAASAAMSAGLLHGVTPITSVVSGSELDNMKTDLAALASAVAVGGSGQIAFIVAPERAARMTIHYPELKLPVLSSVVVPANRVIALDPAALVHMAGASPDISASKNATVQMSDTPVDDGSLGAPMINFYQSECVGIRMILDLRFGKRSANSVAYADNVVGW